MPPDGPAESREGSVGTGEHLNRRTLVAIAPMSCAADERQALEQLCRYIT